jgi:hypothetical protein
MTVIKLFFPTKTKVETEQTGRIAARLERAVPVAPGMLIALMDHSQVEHEDYNSRVTLLDDLDLFKDQEYSGTWGLDVLDVPPRVKKWLRSEYVNPINCVTHRFHAASRLPRFCFVS